MSADDQKIAWMLNQVTAQPEVRHALLLSADGMVRARSTGIDRDSADRVAAAVCAVQAAGREAGALCDGTPDSWRRSLTEFDGGFVMVIRAADGTFLAVGTSKAVDVHVVTDTAHRLVDQLGREMHSAPRHSGGVPT